MSCSCTKPPQPGRCAADGSPRAAGAQVPPMRLTPSLLGQGPRTDRAAPGRRRSDPEVRVASAVARQGAHGELHRSEPSSAVLASWATSTARFPEGSDPGLPVRNADTPGKPRTSNPHGADSSFDVPATWMGARQRPTHRIGSRPEQDSCPAESRKELKICTNLWLDHGGEARPCKVLHDYTILVRGCASKEESIRAWMRACGGAHACGDAAAYACEQTAAEPTAGSRSARRIPARRSASRRPVARCARPDRSRSVRTT